MRAVGDSNTIFHSDFKNTDESPERGNKTNKEMNHSRRYKRNLLTNAQKCFTYLESQSMVSFIEADAEYIVSAGRDHVINIWDAIEGSHIRRLSGHSAPVTGLYLHTYEKAPFDRIIISASEDGTIRRWSLNKGEELGRIATENLITCMGIVNKVLAVTGNNKGFMEVHYLQTGELHSSIFAHADPIDALVVEDIYACSATFEAPSCLKVWIIEIGQTLCIYQIENSLTIEFCSLAMWNSMIILGDAEELKLHVINIKTDERSIIDLGSSRGRVQHVRVWNEWILSCSAITTIAILDVHRVHNYEHFGTFSCNMTDVYGTAAIESDNSLKIVLGGSSLAVLSFDFILTQDAKVTFEKTVKSEKPNFAQNKSHYTMKNTAVNENHGEKSSDSEGDTNEDITCSPYKNIFTKLKAECEEIQSNLFQQDKELETNTGNEKNETIQCILRNKPLPVLTSIHTASVMPPHMKNKQMFMSRNTSIEKMIECYTEPRAAVKKLKKMLDENNQSGDTENCIEKNEKCETVKETRNNNMEEYVENRHEENFDEKNIIGCEGLTEKETNKAIKNEAFNNKILKEDSNLASANINELFTDKKACTDELPKENDKNLKYIDKFNTKKKEKSKPGKKKRKRCNIM